MEWPTYKELKELQYAYQRDHHSSSRFTERDIIFERMVGDKKVTVNIAISLEVRIDLIFEDKELLISWEAITEEKARPISNAHETWHDEAERICENPWIGLLAHTWEQTRPRRNAVKKYMRLCLQNDFKNAAVKLFDIVLTKNTRAYRGWQTHIERIICAEAKNQGQSIDFMKTIRIARQLV